MIKQSKGITLIALVITIIILLILAGISIQALTNTGLFSQASKAKKETQRAQVTEWLNLKLMEEQMNKPTGTAEEIIEATRVASDGNEELAKMGKVVVVDANTSTIEDGEQVAVYFYTQVDEDVYKVEMAGVKFIGEKDKFPSAIIDLSATNTTTVDSITATITHIANESEIKIASCKWVYNTTSSTIGTDESKYTGGTFSSNPQTITLSATTEGTYYLHVLTTDVAGRKKETISNAVTVKAGNEVVKVELKTSLNHNENFDGITITLTNKSDGNKTQEYEMKAGEINHNFTVEENEQYTIKVTDKQDEFYVFETPSEKGIYTAEAGKERIIEMIYQEKEVYLYKNGKENTELVGTFVYKKVDHSSSYSGTGSYSKNDTNMVVNIKNHAYVLMLSNKKVSIEGYSKVSMTGNITQNTNAMCPAVYLMESNNYTYGNNIVGRGNEIRTSSTGIVNVELQIEDMKEAYISAGLNSGWYVTGSMQITEIKLVV